MRRFGPRLIFAESLRKIVAMRCTWIAVVVVCVSVTAAAAKVTKEQKAELKAKLKVAKKQYVSGETEEALATIKEGLAIDPRDLELLLLHGHVLLKMRDFEASLVAYEAYLAAGAKGGNRRKVKAIVSDLRAVTSTFLQVTVENGPANVYLDSKAEGPFCVAAPECKKGVLPDEYKVIVEREGYDKVTEKVAVKLNQTAVLKKALVEKKSEVTVSSTPPAAEVKIDGKSVGATPTKTNVPAGQHQVSVTLRRHAPYSQAIAAHLGQPIEVAAVLSPLVPIEVSVEGASLLLDGEPTLVTQGMLTLPPDGKAHVVTARADGYHPASADVRAETDKVTLRLRRVGSLVRIKGAPRGAEVAFDGKSIGQVPLEEPVEIEPGKHLVDITAQGYLPFKKRGNFPANAATNVEITGLRKPGGKKAFWAGGAAGVALASGVVFSILAINAESNFASRAGEEGVRFDDEELMSLQDRGEAFAVVADISYGAAFLAAGACVYFLVTEGKGFSKGRIRVVPGGISGNF